MFIGTYIELFLVVRSYDGLFGCELTFHLEILTSVYEKFSEALN